MPQNLDHIEQYHTLISDQQTSTQLKKSLSFINISAQAETKTKVVQLK